jgi:hypothetical protein
MSRHRIVVIDRGDLVVVRGWQAGSVLQDGGIKGVYSASAGGHMVDHRRLADVVALLESRHIGVRIVDETPGPGDAA